MPQLTLSRHLGAGLLFLLVSHGFATAARGQDRVEALLQKMTLEEKVGEMTQLTLAAVSKVVGTPDRAHEIDPGKLEEAIVRRHVGSILNTADVAFTVQHWHEVIGAIQDAATRRRRLPIPVLYGVDAVHGANYTMGSVLFPQSIGMAATWSPELVRSAAEVTAREMRASGIPWNFAPVLDLGRHPLWSRFFETYGEDVLLATTLGRAAIVGLQGERGLHAGGVAACMKHFVGYSFPVSGKDRTPAWIPERMLREYFLPPFEAAISAGARTLMVNSGELNGIPVHASREILTNLLRGELQFEGVVVTDWEDVKKLQEMHRVAPNYKEATLLAVRAGIDMCMVPESYDFTDALLELVREEAIPLYRIDASVRRILKLKEQLGLFESPGPEPALVGDVGSASARALSLRAARESVTLLANQDAVLPLSPKAKVLVTGPGAASVPMLHGAWSYSWQGRDDAAYPAGLDTLVGALTKRMGAQQITHVPGASVDEEIDLEAALEAARGVDAVVVAIGEKPSVEKPGDIEDLMLSEAQVHLVKKVKEAGKPVIVVLIQGRPRIVSGIVDQTSAILCAYLPGPFGAQAIAEVLVGDVNPSGRLPFTYPRHSGSLVPYDHKESARFDKDFGQNAFRPQFPFGHGLSYTHFSYSDLEVAPRTLEPGGTLTVKVTVSNRGERAGQEVVQLFVRDDYASVTPPVQRLRGYEKVSLDPAERRQVTFSLTPKDLAFVGRDLRWVTEPGTFEVRIGGLAASFSYVSPR